MNDHPAPDDRWARGILDFVVTFWPSLATLPVLTLAARFHCPWTGMGIFLGMALARKWWWTCVFGLINAGAILGGFIGCALIAARLAQ